MHDQRGNLDETHVPAPRDPADDDVAVGTAHTDHDTNHDAAHDADGDAEAYPAGTYASGSAVGDADRADLTDRDDVEVVDHDQALADERAEDDADTDTDADADAEAAAEAEADAQDGLDVEEAAEVEAEAHDENEARGDGDFVPSDVEPPADETDAADRVDQLDQVDQVDQLDPVGPVDEVDEAETAAVEDREDRAWAADHATQLRAGSLPDTEAEADIHTDTYVDADAEAVAEADDADDDNDNDNDNDRDDTLVEPVHTSEALEGGEALDAGDVVAVPVPVDTDADTGTAGTADGAGRDLLPGSVEAVPVGAIWAGGAADGLRERWRELQLRFIDDPRSVAGEADQLIGEAVASVTGALESQRAQLNAWQGQGGDDTERLRAAVRQYRDFLDRLLGL